MAAIEKIYATREQRRELKRFVRRLRLPGYVKRAIFRRFYSAKWVAGYKGAGAITILECWMDRLLWRQPALPGWAREAISFQHNGSPNDGEVKS
jgi:hypothetical protein